VTALAPSLAANPSPNQEGTLTTRKTRRRDDEREQADREAIWAADATRSDALLNRIEDRISKMSTTTIYPAPPLSAPDATTAPHTDPRRDLIPESAPEPPDPYLIRLQTGELVDSRTLSVEQYVAIRPQLIRPPSDGIIS
jgi:hypothetical protein